MPTGIPNSLLEIIKTQPILYATLRYLRFKFGTALGARSFEGVPGLVHYNDFIFDTSAHYSKRGKELIELLECTLSLAGKSWGDLEKCLEIGCGYGSIIRYLVEKVSPEKIWVTDSLREGSEFCEKTFGVNFIPEIQDYKAELFGKFDLIFLSSVFTHLNEATIKRLWHKIISLTRSGGIIFFTTHGETAIKRLEVFPKFIQKKGQEIETSLLHSGYCYYRYPYYKEDYGLSWHSANYVKPYFLREFSNKLRHLVTEEGAFDKLQDVHVFQRA